MACDVSGRGAAGPFTSQSRTLANFTGRDRDLRVPPSGMSLPHQSAPGCSSSSWGAKGFRKDLVSVCEDPFVLLPGRCPEGPITLPQRGLNIHVHCCSLHNSQKMDEWIMKM